MNIYEYLLPFLQMSPSQSQLAAQQQGIGYTDETYFYDPNAFMGAYGMYLTPYDSSRADLAAEVGNLDAAKNVLESQSTLGEVQKGLGMTGLSSGYAMSRGTDALRKVSSDMAVNRIKGLEKQKKIEADFRSDIYGDLGQLAGLGAFDFETANWATNEYGNLSVAKEIIGGPWQPAEVGGALWQEYMNINPNAVDESWQGYGDTTPYSPEYEETLDEILEPQIDPIYSTEYEGEPVQYTYSEIHENWGSWNPFYGQDFIMGPDGPEYTGEDFDWADVDFTEYEDTEGSCYDQCVALYQADFSLLQQCLAGCG